MTSPDVIELAEEEIDKLIAVCHKQGLNYWEILGIFLERCQSLRLQADAEYHLKGGK